MKENFGTKPKWLTFDCYGTLIQWDEGLIAAVERILGKQNTTVDPARFTHCLTGMSMRSSRRNPTAHSARSPPRACA